MQVIRGVIINYIFIKKPILFYLKYVLLFNKQELSAQPYGTTPTGPRANPVQIKQANLKE
jgi:hypothetical protein